MAKGKITTTATDAAGRWAQNLGASTPKIQAGVQAVQTAPGAAAASQKSKYIQNVQANADKWATRVGAVSLGDWQNAVITKGIPRISQGATAAKPKFEQFLGALLPYQQTQLQALKSMPSLTLADNVNRAVTWINAMAKFQYKK